MTKWIHIKDELFTCLDDEQYELFKVRLWSVAKGGYAGSKRAANKSPYLLHRLAIGVVGTKEVDHVNGNRLDNRLCNLRIVERAENMHNIKRRGVYYRKREDIWEARIGTRYIGRFTSEVGAIQAYQQASRERSEHSYFNRPDNPMPAITPAEAAAAISYRLDLKVAAESTRIAKGSAAKSRPVINDRGEKFPSGLSASQHYGIATSSIRSCCIGKGRQAGGMTWRFADD